MQNRVTAIELLDYCIAASGFVLLNVPKFYSLKNRNNVKNTSPCPTHLNVNSNKKNLIFFNVRGQHYRGHVMVQSYSYFNYDLLSFVQLIAI